MTVALILSVIIYNFSILLLAGPALPWTAFQLVSKVRRRTGLKQRLGIAPQGVGNVIWVHAVSVGEVRAVLPMMKILKEKLGSEVRLYLSTVTVTGQETARKECPEADVIFYFPLDLPFATSRAISRVKPAIFVTVETEFWPNFLAVCFLRRIPVVVVNGRISDHSYRMYKIVRWFFRPFLKEIQFFNMQSLLDARRILYLGARPEKIAVTGNAKYDRTPVSTSIPEEIVPWGDGLPVLVAGSTHQGEEKELIDLLRRPEIKKRGLRLVLVPRHPERFEEVASLLENEGVSFTLYSRAAGGEEVRGEVLLVDTMGLLDGFYNMSDISFVGGSLVDVGGHNLLEPAMLGKPVLTGPHIQNFRDIAEVLVESGGAQIVEDGQSMADALLNLIDNPEVSESMGKAARLASEKAVGASVKNAGKIISLLKEKR